MGVNAWGYNPNHESWEMKIVNEYGNDRLLLRSTIIRISDSGEVERTTIKERRFSLQEAFFRLWGKDE